MTVGRQIREALLARGGSSRSARAEARALLDQVGIPDSDRRLDQYPFELSGGMAQRVMIAIALAARPELLIADEPTTALDVTIQAQILHLLAKLQSETGAGILLITHDIGVVAETAHEVAVMYAGTVVERGPTELVLAAPSPPVHAASAAEHPDARGAAGRAARGDRRRGRRTRRMAAGLPLRAPVPACARALRRRDARPDGGRPGARRGLRPPAGDRSVSAPLLEVRDLRVHFPVRGALPWITEASHPGGGRGGLRPAAGRDARRGGRERLREDDTRRGDPRAAGRDRRNGAVRGTRTRRRPRGR